VSILATSNVQKRRQRTRRGNLSPLQRSDHGSLNAELTFRLKGSCWRVVREVTLSRAITLRSPEGVAMICQGIETGPRHFSLEWIPWSITRLIWKHRAIRYFWYFYGSTSVSSFLVCWNSTSSWLRCLTIPVPELSINTRLLIQSKIQPIIAVDCCR